MSIQVKIKNQAETETKITLDKTNPHIQLKTANVFVPENIAIELEGGDQSDATVTAADILNNKIAYADGERVVGTIQIYDNTYTEQDHPVSSN